MGPQIIIKALLIAFSIYSSSSANPTVQPKARSLHGSCEILINEIIIGENGYVEIGKMCPSNPKLKNRKTDLNGFVLILVKPTDNVLTIAQVTNLNSVQLVPSESSVASPDAPFSRGRRPQSPVSRSPKRPGRGRSKTRPGISTPGPEQDTIEDTSRRQVDVELFRAINLKFSHQIQDGVLAIFLLHLNALQRRRSLPYKDNDVLTDSLYSSMKNSIHDAIILGNSGDDFDSRITEISPTRKISPLLWPEVEEQNENNGLSKCDTNKKLFNPEGFKYAKRSREDPNFCNPNQEFLLKKTLTFPYGPFKGKTIGTQALELTMNLVASLQFYKKNKNVFEMEPKKLAAKLVNIGWRTIYRAEKRLKESGTLARSVKRKPFSKVISLLNDDIKATVYDAITSFYKENLVPTLRPIYDRFLQYVARDNVTVSTGGGATLFKCGFGTFRKILKLEDYKYAKVNHRDALVHNPDKIAWRGRYLRRIRRNEESHEFNVIYLDETCKADTHAVIQKSWVRSCYATMAERRDFALANFKAGKGRRLIIIAAGNEEGFVEGSTFVRIIGKNEVNTDDYHDNINAEAFRKWFFELMDTLDRISTKKYLIVMDNAPSHSEVTIKSGANKQQMIAWIEQQQERGYPVPENFRTRRNWELKEVIKELKQQAPHHKLDDYARERGHEIVRIPPFQCELNPIEEVWKDIKHELKKQNIDQNIANQYERAKLILQAYPKEKWAAHVRHIKRLEADYWEKDGVYDEFLTRNPDIEEIVTNEQTSEIDVDVDNTGQDSDDSSNSSDEDEATVGQSIPSPTQSPCEINWHGEEAC